MSYASSYLRIFTRTFNSALYISELNTQPEPEKTYSHIKKNYNGATKKRARVKIGFSRKRLVDDAAGYQEKYTDHFAG